MRYSLILCLLAGPGWAECPALPDRSVQIDSLVERLKSAPHEGAARQLSAQMWEIWLQAPDAVAQSMLDEGVALLQMGAHGSSRRVLSRLVAYCPDYPEGYNQRAFAAFLMGDYDAAIEDLDRAIALQPVHLGALTGKALSLLGLGREAEAQEVLRAALAINPWLAERALLEEPPGEDI